MTRLLFAVALACFLIAGSTAAAAERRCPEGYLLQRAGECIKIVGVEVLGRIDVLTDQLTDECARDGAYPPIIHDEETNTRLASLYLRGFGAWFLVLGVVCDPATDRFRWVDGSPFDYNRTKDTNESCAGRFVYLYAKYDASWPIDDLTHMYYYTWTMVCVKPHVRAQSDTATACPAGYEPLQRREPGDNRTACYQARTDAADWGTARRACEDDQATLVSIHDDEENAFVRSLLLSSSGSASAMGAHLGATVTGKDLLVFGWTDGSSMDYANFAPGFPMPGLGDCAAMDVSSGAWMNEDCQTRLPFVCKKEEAITPACGSRVYAPGETITPPGYPRSASEPCDYILKVDAGKIVELEILMLEANACCDHLLLFNGQFDSEPFANLTGSDRAGELYRTTSSTNLMRVSWRPQSAVNVKGFAITYRAV